MTLGYRTKGKIKISMNKYIGKMLCIMPTNMKGNVKTPATGHLFNVNPDARKSPKATAQIFHHLVAKLFYLSR